MDAVSGAPARTLRVRMRVATSNARPIPRNYWAVASCLLAAMMLPLFGFFALSTITWQDPLGLQASFNLLTPSATAFISHNSLNLALLIAFLMIAPLVLLALALVFEPEPRRPFEDGGVRLALASNALMVLLVIVTVFPLFGY